MVEWTGALYADTPTVEVETWIDAPPEKVWALVADIEMMPTLSAELQSVEWLDGVTGPSVGHRFIGRSKHEALGEWQTTSYVVEYEPGSVFAWAVEDLDQPTAIWRFRLEPKDAGTQLSQWAQLGPGRSGLSHAIDRMPEKEQKIVYVRLKEWEQGMTQNLEGIKQRLEASE
jgi:uncharacterized protein YndB with AHSA1/START domain